MLIFLGIAILIYGSMHLYALSKMWLAFPHTTGLLIALALTGIAMTLSPLLVWFTGRQEWHGTTVIASWVTYTWMGLLLLFCLIALLFDIGYLAANLFSINWPLSNATSLLSISLLALAMLGYGLLEARQLRVEKITLTTTKLASGKITIAQLSDMHLGAMLGDAYLDRIVAKLHELKPDIIVATGDIVDGQGDDLHALAQHFHALKPPKGAYAIIGNHEFYAWLDNSLHFLNNAGFTVLRGESVATGGIMLAGIDDPSAGAIAKDFSANTRKTLITAHQNTFIVLLKHQPRIDDDIPFDLQLSGHIHGGQIFPIAFITRMVYGIDAGLTQLTGGRLLYTSRGAGTWGPPIRIFAPPEITLITIASEKK